MKLSIVIPAYNEASTIKEVLSRIGEVPFDKEIIVVDDGSSDGTGEILKEVSRNGSNIKLFQHEKNKGKGAALRTAFTAVTNEVIIIQDADLEYDPCDYQSLLGPILDGKADVVFGSRFLGGPHRVLYFWHFVGNKLLTLLSNMLTNLNLSDMETGYKAFRKEVLKDLRIRSNRFGIEPELTAKVAKRKFRIYEVPISYSGRTYLEGKKITWRDGLAAIFLIVWFHFFD